MHRLNLQLIGFALAAISAIRSPAETGQFMREQYEIYEKKTISLGLRQ